MASPPFAPPALGVGMVYFPRFEPLLQQCGEWLDVIEIEPQEHWIRKAGGDGHRLDVEALARLAALPQRKLLHGVGLPLGGTVDFDPDQAQAWRDTVARLQPAWVSEHLAFQRAPDGAGRQHHAGILLPPLQNAETAALAVQRIAALRQLSARPVAFETAPNYLRPQPGEMTDGAFFAEVAIRADCGIVLDLHNLWRNERSGRQPVHEVLSQLPLERVWELHLAGGQSHRGYWLDAHSDLVPGPVMALLEEWLPQLPKVGAVIFEILPEYAAARGLSDEQLRDQLEAVKRLWNRRPRAATTPPRHRAAMLDTLPAAQWERCLAALANGRPAPDAPPWLAGDPGIAVYRALIESSRAGTLVERLPLSYRLLVLTLGDAATWQLLRDFWSSTWPQADSLDELLAFEHFIAAHLGNGRLDLPELHAVLAYELAHAQAAAQHRELFVPMDCEPPALLAALASGQLPAGGPGGHYEVSGAR